MINLWYIFVLPTFFLRSATTTTECPFFCQCYQQSGINSIFCVNVDRRYIPNYFNFDVKLLNFSGNSLLHLSQSAFQNHRYKTLEILDLRQNAITKIDNKAFNKLENLLEIDLSRNHLHSINRKMFKRNKFLNTVIFSENPIKEIKEFSFPPSIYFRRLDFQRCDIYKIHKFAFSNLPTIEYINLKNNHLKSLSPSVLSNIPKLKQLLIDDNPWRCNRALWFLLKYLHKHKIGTDSMLCVYGETSTAILWDTMELNNPRKFKHNHLNADVHKFKWTVKSQRRRRSFTRKPLDHQNRFPEDSNLVIESEGLYGHRNYSISRGNGNEEKRRGNDDHQEEGGSYNHESQHQLHRGKDREFPDSRYGVSFAGGLNVNNIEGSLPYSLKNVPVIGNAPMSRSNENSDSDEKYEKRSQYIDNLRSDEHQNTKIANWVQTKEVGQEPEQATKLIPLPQNDLLRKSDVVYIFSDDYTNGHSRKGLDDVHRQHITNDGKIKNETNPEAPETDGEAINMNVMLTLIAVEFALLVVLLYILYKLWKWNKNGYETAANILLNSTNEVVKTYDTYSPGYKRYSLPDDTLSLKISNYEDRKCDNESGYLSYHRYNSTEGENTSIDEFSFYERHQQEGNIARSCKFQNRNIENSSQRLFAPVTYESLNNEMDRNVRRHLSVRSLGRRAKINYYRRSVSADNANPHDANDNH